MYKFCTLFSGSSGNSTYIGTDEHGILIDAGKNAKQVTLSLLEEGLSPDCVEALFITHEHSDHIGALRVFCKKHGIPVYASRGTLEALDKGGHLNGDFPVYEMIEFADVGEFHIECFHTMHDAAESMGYTVELENGFKAAVATDLGVITNEVRAGIIGCNAVLLESNHDIGMLSNGPYPYPLKRRILSDSGHLCNAAAAEMAVELIENGTEHILLGHLSHENNLPELAFETTFSALCGEGARIDLDYTLSVAGRHRPSDVKL